MKLEIDFIEGYDEEQIIGELKRLAALLGKTTLSKKDLKAPGRVSYETIARRFGSFRNLGRFCSWKKALISAAASVDVVDATSADLLAEAATRPANGNGRKPLSTGKRFFVLKRDRYRCKLCSRTGIELEVDHIIPVAQGGSDGLDYLQSLCFDCNRGKRDSLQ